MGVKAKPKEREVRIEYMRLDEIQRDKSNPKEHDLSALAESLERFGFVSPMGINEKTGKLLWGHGRLDDLVAFMEEGKSALDGIHIDDDGMWKAPVVRGVHLNPKDGTAYLISDNRQVGLGGWNEPKLVETLIRIAGGDGRGLRGTGYDGDDVDTLIRLYRPDLIDMLEDPGPQIDKAKELQEKWGTATGQVWELNDHRLAVGDCTDPAVVEAVIRGERAGSVVTDPPYGIEREGILNDDPEGLRDLYDGCLAAMPIDNAVVIAFQSPRLFWVWLDAVRDAGHVIERMLWMYKPNDETFPWRGWLQKSEAILISRFGKGQWVEVHPYVNDCYSPTTLGQELPKEWGKAHASVKPLAVIQDLVSRVGGDVYDPFVGSGTTIVACERLGRKARAIEIDPGYVGVCLQRWVDMTNLEPRLMTP